MEDGVQGKTERAAELIPKSGNGEGGAGKGATVAYLNRFGRLNTAMHFPRIETCI
jgi:hypothetical protein